jgi:hypothetical protein
MVTYCDYIGGASIDSNAQVVQITNISVLNFIGKIKTNKSDKIDPFKMQQFF